MRRNRLRKSSNYNARNILLGSFILCWVFIVLYFLRSAHEAVHVDAEIPQAQDPDGQMNSNAGGHDVPQPLQPGTNQQSKTEAKANEVDLTNQVLLSSELPLMADVGENHPFSSFVRLYNTRYSPGNAKEECPHQQSKEAWITASDTALQSATADTVLFTAQGDMGPTFIEDFPVMPHPITQAATWNPESVAQVGRYSIATAMSLGVQMLYGPSVAVSSGAWHNFKMGYGSEAHLVSKMVEAFVSSGVGRENHVKVALRDVGFSDPHRRVEEYGKNVWSPIQAGLKAGAGAVLLSAGNGVSSSPLTGDDAGKISKHLRNEMGFDGVVLANCTVYNSCPGSPSFASFMKSVDVWIATSITQAQQQLISSPELMIALQVSNERIRRIASTFAPRKERMAEGGKALGSDREQYARLSAEIAQEGVTILKNNDILPLNDVATQTILIAGPAGNSISYQLGGCKAPPISEEEEGEMIQPSSIFSGIDDTSSSATVVQYRQGCTFSSKQSEEEDRTLRTKLLGDAEFADFVLFVVGDDGNMLPNKDGTVPLAESQHDLITDLVTMEKQIILILVGSHPIALTDDIVEAAEAILFAYLPGPYGGEAIANTMFGKKAPTGHLPFNYFDQQGHVRWPIGHGLTYSAFQFVDLDIRVETDVVEIKFVVQNDGAEEASEVVQLYIGEESSKQETLVKFEKVMIGAFQTYDMFFELRREDIELASWQFTGQKSQIKFEVAVGGGDKVHYVKGRFTWNS